MITLIVREFTVNVGLQRAWDHLARIEQWPSWAPHIKQIELEPRGELRPQSTGVLHLTNGMKATFRMTEFDPPRNWAWVSRLLWFTVIYDHRFAALDAERTKIVFVVQATGLGAGIVGPLFARLYRANLEKAVPRLIAELNALPASV
ncbi:MAG TPA: SRPBCC family protein [Pirellulaceae bacterium]|nr:SRPBCC family protein [Pirellulaceae bacterium]